MFGTVTYYFPRPIGGTLLLDGRRETWTMREITFKVLTGDQAQPSHGLVFNCHKALRDSEGNAIPVEVLSLLDLEDGVRTAFTQATAHAFSPAPTAG